MPDGSDLSSGSRVRFPVMTTRLMFVAAMVGRLLSAFELSAWRVYGRVRRDPPELPVLRQKRCEVGTVRDREGAKRGPLPCAVQRHAGAVASRTGGHRIRAREARILSETAAREVSNSGEAAQPADAPA